MRKAFLATCVLGVITTLGCGGGDDPFAGGGGDDEPAGAPDAADARACVAPPARIVVLGDSITACSVVGGPQGSNCVSRQVADYVKAEYAPDARYENYAVGGARLDDLPGQLAEVPAGDGPVLLVVYMGGNDLAPYIFQSDNAAMQAWTSLSVRMREVWEGVFATVASDDRFADGVTVLMNTQYNPFDDCTAPPYNLSQLKTQILHMFNASMVSLAAEAGDTALLVHQHEPFLGHGHHRNVMACPHYQPGADAYMADTIHANAAGNAALAEVMKAGVDRLYRDCTR